MAIARPVSVLLFALLAALVVVDVSAFRRRLRRSRQFQNDQSQINRLWRETQPRPLDQAVAISRATENFAVAESRCASTESTIAAAYTYAISSVASSATGARTGCPSGHVLAMPKSTLEAQAVWKIAAGSAPANQRSSCFNYTFGTSPGAKIDGVATVVLTDAWACQQWCQQHNIDAAAANNGTALCAYFNWAPTASGDSGSCSLATEDAVYITDVNTVISGPPACADLTQGCTTRSQGQTPISGIEREAKSVAQTWMQCQARCAALGVNETNRNKAWWNSSWDLSFNGDLATLADSAGDNCTNPTAFPNQCSYTSACTYFSWWPNGECFVTADTQYHWGERNASLVVQSVAKGTGATIVTGPTECVVYDDSNITSIGSSTYFDGNGNEIPFAGLGVSIANTWPQVALSGTYLWIGGAYNTTRTSWQWDDNQVIDSLDTTSAQVDRFCQTGINDSTSTVCCSSQCGLCNQDTTCRLRPGGEDQCCPTAIRSGRACSHFTPPCVLGDANATAYENWGVGQGNRRSLNHAKEPFAALNRFDGLWYDFPGEAQAGSGFFFHAICQKEVVETRAVSTIVGSIPADEMNFLATSERDRDSRELAGTHIPVGQCQAEFAADDGDESVGCRGHCFQTTGTRGAESMRGQYIQVEFATPRNLTGFGIRGLGSGPMWGFVSELSMTQSLDNVAYERVDGTRLFTLPHRQSGNCSSSIHRLNFVAPVVAKYIRFYPQRWSHYPSLRLTLYGCDAKVTHGSFSVLSPDSSDFDLSSSACSEVVSVRYDSAALTPAVIVADTAACCGECGRTVGCFSWSFSITNGSCLLRSAPLNGAGVSDALYTSGSRPPAQGKSTCDLGWTGHLCQKRDLYKPSTGLAIPAFTRLDFLATMPIDEYVNDGDNRLNIECTGGNVLTHNPSVTAGIGGALDVSACEIVCTEDARCVAFSWRSNFECYTYSTCDNPNTIIGRGAWTAYLYLKLSMADRLQRFNNTAWQPFTVGNSLLFGEGSSHWSAISSSGPISSAFAVDGQRVHDNVSTGLWYNPASFASEDFIEVPINGSTTDAQVASVTIWNYCVSPGDTYDNEGAAVSLRLSNGTYFYCGIIGNIAPCTFFTVACTPGIGVFASAVRLSSTDSTQRLAVAEIEAFEGDSSTCEANYYLGDGSGIIADRTAASACPAVSQNSGCSSTDVGCMCGKQRSCNATIGCPCQGEACIDGACEAAWIATEACQVPSNTAGVPQTSLLFTVFQYFNDFDEAVLQPLLAAEEVSFAMAECAANCTFRCCQLEVGYVSPGTLTRQQLRCSGANASGTVYSTTTSVLYRPHKVGQPNGYSPCFMDSECRSGYCDKVTDPRQGQGMCGAPPSWVATSATTTGAGSNGDVRLVDGPNQYAGRVEVWIETVTAAPSSTAPPPPPQWYTVCDDYWNSQDAEVVCRRAGFPAIGAIAYKTAFFGQGTVSIGLDNLACRGNETSLLDCPRFGGLDVYQHNCEHSDDAGVQCADPDQPSTDTFIISLKNGTVDTTALGFGRVEIWAPLLSSTGAQASNKAHWVNQTVCNDGFTDDDAAVVCRSLGMLGGVAVPNIIFDGDTIRSFYGGPGNDTQAIMLDELGCDGTESWLLNCSHNGREATNCAHWEDAAVICINTTVDSESFAPTPISAASTTTAPSFAPTFRGAVGNFTCGSTLSSVTAASTGCELGWDASDVVWRENPNGGFGQATYDPVFNHNPLRHLSFPLSTSINYTAGYWVRIEWTAPDGSSISTSCEHITFYVPPGSNIFATIPQKHLAVTNVTFSAGGGGGVSTDTTSSVFGTTSPSSASFCHTCTGVTSNYRPGDTCWAITPTGDSNRSCGCSGQAGAGSGIYYGGFANGTQTTCDGWSGGFAGPKTADERKGGLGSLGMQISVQQTCTSETPTTVPTSAPTRSQAPTTSAPTPLQCARSYAQCGGTGWSGPTNCVQDHFCQSSHGFLSRCVPSYPAGVSHQLWAHCSHDTDCFGTLYCDDWDNWNNVTKVYFKSKKSPTFTCQDIPICPAGGSVVVSAPTSTPTSGHPTAPTAPTAPTQSPTQGPTLVPTTLAPSDAPSVHPTAQPSRVPSTTPTRNPSDMPTTIGPSSAAPTKGPTTQAPSSAAPTVQPSISNCLGHPMDPAGCQQFRNDCNDQAVRITCPVTCNECSLAPTMASFTYSPTSPTDAPSIPDVTVAPSLQPTRFPTRQPTELPTEAPSTTPTESPTSGPTTVPSASPTSLPTEVPSAVPTMSPTVTVTLGPTLTPTASPTDVPTTRAPTLLNSPTTNGPTSGRPTGLPTTRPTLAPSAAPTNAPVISTTTTATATSETSTVLTTTSMTTSSVTTRTETTSTTTSTTTQSAIPTAVPSNVPSTAPSAAPTATPTGPTESPTAAPTSTPTTPTPTASPSENPTDQPTAAPTPSAAPTVSRRRNRRDASTSATMTTSSTTSSTRTSTVTSTSSVSSTGTTVTTVTSVTTATQTYTTATTQPCDTWFGNILNGGYGNCTIGQYLDEGSVGTVSAGSSICQDCVEGTYMDERAHQHTQCKAYDVRLCSPGYYLVEDRSISSDRLCAPCGGGDLSSASGALSEFQSELGYVGTSCNAVSKCAKGHYSAGTPTDSRDRDCLPCEAGSYQPNSDYIDVSCLACGSEQFSGEGAGSCTAHSTCATTEFSLASGTAVSDAVCTSCQQGQYFIEGGALLDTFSSLGQDTSCGGSGVFFNDSTGTSWPFNHTTSGDFEDCLQICSANENCTAYEEMQTELLCLFYGHATITTTTEVDRHCFARAKVTTSCQPCEMSTYMTLTKHVNRSCASATLCQPGEFMVESAWPDSNAICASCPSPLYQDAEDHSFRTCKTPTVCQSLALDTLLPSTPTSDTQCLTTAASSGIGGDTASSTSFAVLILLIIITCVICFTLHRRYGGGKVAKAKREARERKMKEAKTEEGREPDDDSDMDDSDDEDAMLAGGIITGVMGGGVKLPKTAAQTGQLYQSGVVEPKHIEGSRVTFLDKLGEGAFGAVYLGFYESPDDESNNIGGAYNVAVKVLKQGALTKKQLQMMTRAEIVVALQSLDETNVPRVTAYSEGISAGSDASAYSEATEGVVDETAITASPTKPKSYNHMVRDELITELLDRQHLAHSELNATAINKGQLMDDSQWTMEDIKGELVNMDRDLSDARYRSLDHEELIAVALERQAEGVVLDGNSFERIHLTRMHKDELVALVDRFDAKKLRIENYERMNKRQLVEAYLQRDHATMDEKTLSTLIEVDICELLLELDEDAGEDEFGDGFVGAAPLTGMYDRMHKDDLVEAVLARQQDIADAEHEAKMKEAYRDFWWEARTMAALGAGRGQFRIRYGKMTRKKLATEAAERDAQHEERRRIKKGYIPKEDTSLPVQSNGKHAKVMMTTAETKSWVDQRKVEWGKRVEDGGWSEDQLTGLLLNYDEQEGRLFGHANITKIIGIVVDEKPTQVLLQLAEGGELKQFLEAHDPHVAYKVLDQPALLTMCHDVCCGMQYLEQEGWIHGDLACRNVLINSLQVCQVADFGLSKFQGLDIENNGRDENGKMTGRIANKEKKLRYVKYSTQYPVRWVPPEVIGPGKDRKAKRHFSHKSDVWAFGITMYEIFTAAETPYLRITDSRYTADGPMRNKEVKKFVLGGGRLPCPEECEPAIFNQIVAPCFIESPKNRPSFDVLGKRIEQFLKRAMKNHTSRKVRFKTHLAGRVTVNTDKSDHGNDHQDSGNSSAGAKHVSETPYDAAAGKSKSKGRAVAGAYEAADETNDAYGADESAYDDTSEKKATGSRTTVGGADESPYDAANDQKTAGGRKPVEDAYGANESPYDAANDQKTASGRKPVEDAYGANESPYDAANDQKTAGGADESPYDAADAPHQTSLV